MRCETTMRGGFDRPLRTLALLLLALALQCTVAVPTAEAHLPPPAFFNIRIEDTQTSLELVVQDGVARDWFGIEAGAAMPSGEALSIKQRAEVERQLRSWLRVAVNGLPAMARLADATTESFKDHLQTWHYVKFQIVVPTEAAPKQVAIAWTRYARDTKHVFDEIDVDLEAYGESSYPVLREREPEFVWHRPREVAEPPPLIVPTAVEPPTIALPWASLGILVVLVGWSLVGRRRQSRRRLALGWVGGLALAALLFGPLKITVPAPWEGGLVRPEEARALAIFGSLHRGVYGALDGESEEAIYDTLAESVTGELLPRLYLDIHESLILKEEGGVVAKVKKTEILEATLQPDGEPGAPWFLVRARWRVEGKVGHWGHTHHRINEYVGDVTIVAVDGRWKIAGLEVLEETRVDDGKQVGRPPRSGDAPK